MKIKIFLIVVVVLLSSTSCSKWLNVTPQDTIAEDDFFRVGTGYRNALNGVYKQISGSSLYGRELSWGMSDVLAQCYLSSKLNSSHAYGILSRGYEYDNDNVEPYIEGVWATAYNAIANCNNIIGRVGSEDNSKFIGGELERELILGEALSLRGLIHFDILRLFAAAPIKKSVEQYVPYYDKYPSYGEPNIATKEFLDKIIKDLKDAQVLVVKFDTLNSEHINWLRPQVRFTADASIPSYFPTDIFFSHRGYRMNYCAITAILARVYNYAGKHDLAIIEAQKVIDFKDGDDKLIFNFTEYSKGDGNRKLSDDIIFSLSDLKLYDNYKNYYPGVDVSSLSVELYIDDNYGDMFDDNSDIRLKLLNKVGNWDVTSNKNVAPIVSNDYSKIVEDMLPVIRMSEMHLIIAEYHAANGDFISATNSIDILRAGRNCTKGALEITDFNSFKKTLIEEANREYFGEGQLFFYHKKYNIRPSFSMSDDKLFILPRPEKEDIN